MWTRGFLFDLRFLGSQCNEPDGVTFQRNRVQKATRIVSKESRHSFHLVHEARKGVHHRTRVRCIRSVKTLNMPRLDSDTRRRGNRFARKIRSCAAPRQPVQPVI